MTLPIPEQKTDEDRQAARDRLKAAHLLVSSGVRVRQVYRVYVEDRAEQTEILFSTPDGRAETALVSGDGTIVTRGGW